MASAVARAYNRGLGAEPPAGVQSRERSPRWGVRGAKPPWSWKLFSICTSSRSGKFVIFSVYFQYFARASVLFARETDIKHRDAVWLLFTILGPDYRQICNLYYGRSCSCAQDRLSRRLRAWSWYDHVMEYREEPFEFDITIIARSNAVCFHHFHHYDGSG